MRRFMLVNLHLLLALLYQFSLIDKNILLLAPVFISCSSFFLFCLLKHFIHENQVLINDIFKK